MGMAESAYHQDCQGDKTDVGNDTLEPGAEPLVEPHASSEKSLLNITHQLGLSVVAHSSAVSSVCVPLRFTATAWFLAQEILLTNQ